MGLGPDWDGLRAAAPWRALPVDHGVLAESIDDARFPGALVPARAPGGDLMVYGVAEDGPTWRRLQPLLLAFAGPTVTSFDGAPAALDVTDPVEGILASATPYAVARLRAGRQPDGERVAVRALLRLRDVLARVPDLAKVQPLPTSRLLASLQDALNVRDTDEAWRLHGVLRSELRLDAANLVQLEIAILGAVEDWEAIRAHPSFEALCGSRPPAAVAELLLEALYRRGLPGEISSEDAQARVKPYADLLLPLVPTSAREAVQRLQLLFAVDVGSSDEARSDEPSDAEAILSAAPAPSVEDAPTRARRALLDVADNLDDSAARGMALAAVEALSPEAREALLEAPWFRTLWSEVVKSSAGQVQPVGGWADWLARLPDEVFDAAAYARRAAAEWRLPDAHVDADEGRVLAAACLSVPDGLADQRMAEALPFWVAWAEADPRWPRAAYRPVYAALLLRIALGARRNEQILRSGAVILEGLMRTGLDESEYRDAVDAVEAIIGSGLNRSLVYEALEYLDILSAFPALDAGVLAGLRERTRSSLQALFGRLSAAQRAAVRTAFPDEVGWDDRGATEDDGGLAARLRNHRIAVYTLTESAGRQARDALLVAAPGAKVLLNHDHVGTQALASLASGADLFVVAWASATHAATDFIRARRGDRPLIYARGRGASSIIHAVERAAR